MEINQKRIKLSPLISACNRNLLVLRHYTEWKALRYSALTGPLRDDGSMGYKRQQGPPNQHDPHTYKITGAEVVGTGLPGSVPDRALNLKGEVDTCCHL